MIRKSFLFTLIALGVTSAPLNCYSDKQLPHSFVLSACLTPSVYIVMSAIYGAIDGQTDTGYADHIQLYEAVRLQESWWLPRACSGIFREERLLNKAQAAGRKRSTLYREALDFAEDIYDKKVAKILLERLNAQEKAELAAQAPVIPTPEISPKKNPTDLALLHG